MLKAPVFDRKDGAYLYLFFVLNAAGWGLVAGAFWSGLLDGGIGEQLGSITFTIGNAVKAISISNRMFGD